MFPQVALKLFVFILFPQVALELFVFMLFPPVSLKSVEFRCFVVVSTLRLLPTPDRYISRAQVSVKREGLCTCPSQQFLLMSVPGFLGRTEQVAPPTRTLFSSAFGGLFTARSPTRSVGDVTQSQPISATRGFPVLHE